MLPRGHYEGRRIVDYELILKREIARSAQAQTTKQQAPDLV
jgi:hypothetical protein